MSIYVASKAKHGAMWLVAKKTKVADIDAQWIYVYQDGMINDWHDHWRMCIDQASMSMAVIAYREEGEHMKGALIEIGAALSHRVPVFLVGHWPDEEVGSWTRYRGVVRCSSMDVAIGLANQACEDDNFFNKLVME